MCTTVVRHSTIYHEKAHEFVVEVLCSHQFVVEVLLVGILDEDESTEWASHPFRVVQSP